MFVCLFVCLVVLMFLGFRPHSHDSVASCLGSKIKNQGWRSAFISLKTKRYNLNARSIIQRKQHYSGMISKNLSTSRSILCSFFEHNRQKLNLCKPPDWSHRQNLGLNSVLPGLATRPQTQITHTRVGRQSLALVDINTLGPDPRKRWLVRIVLID